MNRGRAWLRSCLAALALLWLCAACAPTASTGGADAAAGAGVPPALAPTPPDLSCRVAGDCAVRNVGNCCGYFPACVNKDSPVDPDAVRAECARTGTASICGFEDIQACECADGSCRRVRPTLRVEG